jgi:hypothetical protein
MAMPSPARKEVTSSISVEAANSLSAVATPININAPAMVPSMPHRLLNLIANGAKIPIHKSGREVNKLAIEPLIPKSFCIVPISGEMDVIGGRKFNEARISANNKKINRIFLTSEIISSTNNDVVVSIKAII